ncbi:protein tlpB [Flavobacterium branchiophilum]|uniref:Methylamine utilisation protein MauE domain-containing protein n=1 Tax=Flavobacterium branchiophilum TaxID=55197 RepID=A0A543G685_9FLAO|nr:MauE/DoxX family redox-associated membrane protein [Flavobacterium branchiophilum]OXA80235.1 protein tlpB [Flavobacterium branchiophilum] [Flavobacterium branchiophilum NBRC 15030 = ATCC 35035]TQM41600.1 hypothetical protein BC670_2586 [Flavobacterium branchiophilum]GEM55642.1 protein tlpB [Flavobacterium branchiophilum NBRC 15030 = ATCC 35035]
MNANKNYITWAIRIVVALLFLLSAVAKLYPSPYFAISTFEVKQLYSLGFSEQVAPYFSRILIGIEFALGFLLLQKNYLKTIIIPATILLLVVFVGHLSYVTFLTGGNSGNCGCFGELLPMTPIEAIIKNIVAIGLLGYLYKIYENLSFSKGNFWVLTTVLLGCILGLFMLAPIQPVASKYSVSPIEPTEIDSVSIEVPTKKTVTLDSTIAAIKPTVKAKDSVTKVEEKTQNEPKKVKSGFKSYFSHIDQGKKIMCLFVPGCEHCRAAAKELTAMRLKNPSMPPLSVIFMNEEADLIPDFFKEAGASYPYKIVEIIPFWKILGMGKDTPGIKYLWNGNDIKFYYGIGDQKFNGEELTTIINQSYEELKKHNKNL